MWNRFKIACLAAYLALGISVASAETLPGTKPLTTEGDMMFWLSNSPGLPSESIGFFGDLIHRGSLSSSDEARAQEKATADTALIVVSRQADRLIDCGLCRDGHRAYSTDRVSRKTLTLISPG